MAAIPFLLLQCLDTFWIENEPRGQARFLHLCSTKSGKITTGQTRLFDITILPLSLSTGREQTDLPGLLVISATRKAARLRANDRLILLMSLTNSSPASKAVFSHAQQQEMLTRLAETFFTTSGSVTAGMRAVVARLNDFLLNRNLKSPGEGQVSGALNMGVLHGSTLLLAHAGATQSMLLGSGQVQQFDDRQAGRGLGLSKQIVPRFYQSAVEAGDVLLLTAEPPASWTAKTLAGSSQIGLEHLRRRLLSQAGDDMNAAALKFQPGKGQIIRYRVGAERAPLPGTPAEQERPSEEPAAALDAADFHPEIGPEESPAPTVQPPAVDAVIEPPDEGAQRAESDAASIPLSIEDRSETVSQSLPGIGELGAERGPVDQPESVEPPPVAPQPLRQSHRRQPAQDDAAPQATPAPMRVRPLGGQKPAQQTAAESAAAQARPRPRRREGPGVTHQVGLALKSVFQRGAAARSKVSNVVTPVASRVLPQRTEPLINLSPGSMLFIAIAIPLVVVVIATTVYFNAGRSTQFDAYVSTASQYIDRASQQTDPSLQRESWTQALLWLDKADEYDLTETSLDLRRQAQNGLDNLDGIVRLPYQQAVTEGFSADVNITQMAATLNDVYLLDSSQGRVLRLYRVGSGYLIDSTFVCGPGQAGGRIIGPLIDVAVLPPNNTYRATILAVDVAGNVVYCSPGQSGYDSLVLPAPETNWGNIKAITIADGYIYVLDPQVNAVWYIFGRNGIYDQPPRLFFSNQVPQMDDVIDLAIDSGFLYLLHADGRMTTCEASGFELSPTRCTEPTPYGDSRTGRDPAPLNFPDARFTQMQTTQPPDPSLFILDSAQASIYHFSLRRLNLQRQYRALYNRDFPLPDQPPSAFVITPNRRAVLAFGNRVYYAPLP